MNVAACLVTRGDVKLHRILDSLTDEGIEEIVVWDNSQRQDLGVYGRYAAIAETDAPLILVQDDDCVLPPESIEEIMWTSDSGGSAYGQLVCNMPQRFREQPMYANGDTALVGFGACFHRDLPERAFRQWDHVAISDDGLNADTAWFHRTCDVLFTALTPKVLVDVPYENLPWATDESRMYRQNGHTAERKRMLELALKVRDA